jgi:hypothetical protein
MVGMPTLACRLYIRLHPVESFYFIFFGPIDSLARERAGFGSAVGVGQDFRFDCSERAAPQKNL